LAVSKKGKSEYVTEKSYFIVHLQGSAWGCHFIDSPVRYPSRQMLNIPLEPKAFVEKLFTGSEVEQLL
jgi:hypothetical protein